MQDMEIFDTLGVSKRFREVGIPTEQAEVLVAEMAKLATKQPVSHQDLRQTEERLENRIRETVETSEKRIIALMDIKFEAMEHKFEAIEHKFEAIEHKFDARINRQTIITIGGVAALLAIFQFLVPILS